MNQALRFYYVTSHGDGANPTAVLIYYTSISNDGTTITSTDSSVYAYATPEDINALGYNVENADNLHGPATAYKQLPSITQWSNNQILMVSNESARTRQITDENQQTVTSFTYTGKAARFITLSEVKETCENELEVNPPAPTGDLDSCRYLLENVKEYERENFNFGYFLENSYSTNSDYYIMVNGNGRKIGSNGGSYYVGSPVRPVIEVLKSNIEN